MSKHNGDGVIVKAKDFLEDDQPLQLEMFRAMIWERLEAASYGAPEAPWSPVPLADAREFINADETRKLDMIFPTVYEEDRSVKLKDLAMVQGLDYASHRWASEQSAQELGREDFDYDTEMKTIKKERVTLPPPPEIPGMDTPIAPGAVPPGRGIGAGGDPTGGEFLPPGTPSTDIEQPEKRDQLSGSVQAEFRRQQRQSYLAFKRIGVTMAQFVETMAMMTKTLQETSKVPAHVTMPAATPPNIEVPVQVTIPAAPPQTIEVPLQVILPEQVMPTPHVTVHTQSAKLRTFEVTKRDERGFIREIKEVSNGPARPD